MRLEAQNWAWKEGRGQTMKVLVSNARRTHRHEAVWRKNKIIGERWAGRVFVPRKFMLILSGSNNGIKVGFVVVAVAVL